MQTTTINTPFGPLELPSIPEEASSKLCLTLHWAASTYNVSSFELTKYHFVLGADGAIHKGVPVENNLSFAGHPRPANYAAHVLNANTNNIGISAASMADAAEVEARKGHYGTYPVTEKQIAAIVEIAAQMCFLWNIPVIPTRVLGHEEWDSVNGRPQDRWDVNCIPHLDIRPHLNADGTYDSTNWIRSEIRKRVQALATQSRPELPAGAMDDVDAALKVLYTAAQTGLPMTPDTRRTALKALNEFNGVLVNLGFK